MGNWEAYVFDFIGILREPLLHTNHYLCIFIATTDGEEEPFATRGRFAIYCRLKIVHISREISTLFPFAALVVNLKGQRMCFIRVYLLLSSYLQTHRSCHRVQFSHSATLDRILIIPNPEKVQKYSL